MNDTNGTAGALPHPICVTWPNWVQCAKPCGNTHA